MFAVGKHPAQTRLSNEQSKRSHMAFGDAFGLLGFFFCEKKPNQGENTLSLPSIHRLIPLQTKRPKGQDISASAA